MSSVSVVVIDWTRIGFAPPTPTSPTRTSRVAPAARRERVARERQRSRELGLTPRTQRVAAASNASSSFAGIAAAGLREVGPAAALAADDRRDLADQVAGLEAVLQVGVTPSASVTRPSPAAASSTMPLPSLLAQLVHHARAARRRRRRRPARASTRTPPISSACDARSPDAAPALLGAQRLDLALERARAPRAASRRALGSSPTGARSSSAVRSSARSCSRSVRERARRRSAPRCGARPTRRPTRRHDLEQADVAGGARVRAAAQLGREVAEARPRARGRRTSRRTSRSRRPRSPRGSASRRTRAGAFALDPAVHEVLDRARAARAVTRRVVA